MIRVEQEIIDDDVISNNAPNVVDLFDAIVDYAIGDYARVGNYVYISVATPNVGHDPLTNIGVFWTYWSVSNPHAMFDLYSDTVTNFTANGIVKFERGVKNTLGIGNFTAVNIKIEYLDALDSVLLTENYPVPRREVWNIYEYIYNTFNFNGANFDTIFTPIKKLGVNVRVTFENGGDATSCGYLIAGQQEDMGDTLDNVSFPDRMIGNDTVSVANFDTLVTQNLLSPTSDKAKRSRNIPMMFVIDESESSKFQNIIIVGKIIRVEPRANNLDMNTISWEIEQNKEL